LDAFSGDAIPVHLLTVEAFDIYWKHLNPEHGVIAVHISSNHIDLLPVTGALAEHFRCSYRGRWQAGEAPYQPNLWVFLSRDEDALQIDGLYPNRLNAPGAPPLRLWTDDYSNIFRLLR